MINITKLFERKQENKKTLTKHVPRKNYFVIAKIKIKRLEDKNKSGMTSLR